MVGEFNEYTELVMRVVELRGVATVSNILECWYANGGARGLRWQLFKTPVSEVWSHLLANWTCLQTDETNYSLFLH